MLPQFDRPALLWVAVAAAAVVVALGRGPRGIVGLRLRSPTPGGGGRLRAAVVLRALGAALAVAAAAGPHREAAPPRDRLLLVAAGTAGPAPAPAPPGPRESVLFAAAPDGARAVAAVRASADPGADVRLLLLCAGDDPDPEGAIAALRAAREAGLPTYVRALPAPPPAPAPVAAPAPWLEGLALPSNPSAGEPFLLRPVLAAAARAEAGATIDLSVDGRPAGSFSPRDGKAPALSLSAGTHLIAATCRDGSGAARGSVAATVTIPGAPRVLVVEGSPAPSPLARALESRGLPVTRAAPAAVPADLGPFAVVVLGEGASGDAALEAAVRNGKGLLVCGAAADDAGLGRLRGSPVARALPVFLPPPLPPRLPPPSPLPPADPEPPPPGKGPEVKGAEGERPGAVVTLLVIVDASGSMWGAKMEMARRAAAAAAATLSPGDRFGLLSFTEQPRWEVALGPAGDLLRIDNALRGLEAGGNTDLLPALREAQRALAREKTAVRHCVLLSDGEASPFGLRKVVETMVAGGATLSTVGIGVDFDARLLGNLAVWGKGRTFPAVDPASLPRVVTLDTERIVAAGKEALAKAKPLPDVTPPPSKDAPPKPPDREPTAMEPPKPPARAALEAADPCALLEGIGPWPPAAPPESAPEARQATTLALRFAGEGGPALVLGRHGLGRTAALSFDPSDLAPWEGFAAAMARLVRGLAPAGPGPAVEVLGAEPVEGGTRVRFEVRGSGEGPLPVPRVEVLDPAGDTPSAAPVEREGAHRFAALVPPGPAGPRTLVVAAGGPEVPGIPVAWFEPGGGPKARPWDPGLAARVAAAAGAVLVGEGPLPAPGPARPGTPVRTPLELPFAALAALLLAVDTGLRRAGRN
jgi:hypothetical protein